jgi:hypothetical protein
MISIIMSYEGFSVLVLLAQAIFYVREEVIYLHKTGKGTDILICIIIRNVSFLHNVFTGWCLDNKIMEKKVHKTMYHEGLP